MQKALYGLLCWKRKWLPFLIYAIQGRDQRPASLGASHIYRLHAGATHIHGSDASLDEAVFLGGFRILRLKKRSCLVLVKEVCIESPFGYMLLGFLVVDC